MQRTRILFGALWVVIVALLTFPLHALAFDPTSTSDIQANVPPPQQWQAICILFGPIVIAFVMRWAGSLTHRTLTKAQRKQIAGIMVAAAAIIGMYLDGQLDQWTPTVAGVVYLFVGVHNAYDKLWQAIPGLSHLITAIDPMAAES